MRAAMPASIVLQDINKAKVEAPIWLTAFSSRPPAQLRVSDDVEIVRGSDLIIVTLARSSSPDSRA